MGYLKKTSDYKDHCIIQWYAKNSVTGSKQRNQWHFSNRNVGSQSITEESLELSHARVFYGEYDKYSTRPRKSSFNSYKISPQMAAIKRVPAHPTTDLFLYGHSTIRDYVVPKYIAPKKRREEIRGISIDGHYVSAGKVAQFLNVACSSLQKIPLRIWLLSCHSSSNDLGGRYHAHLCQKLRLLGWENKQIIGFDEAITPETLGTCRVLASGTNLFESLDNPMLRKYQPRSLKW